MTERSGKVRIDYKGRQIEGSYVVFGDRVTLESGGHCRTAYVRGSAIGAEALARIMLRRLAEAGLI
jgi:hypothetical protein